MKHKQPSENPPQMWDYFNIAQQNIASQFMVVIAIRKKQRTPDYLGWGEKVC